MISNCLKRSLLNRRPLVCLETLDVPGRHIIIHFHFIYHPPLSLWRYLARSLVFNKYKEFVIYLPPAIPSCYRFLILINYLLLFIKQLDNIWYLLCLFEQLWRDCINDSLVDRELRTRNNYQYQAHTGGYISGLGDVSHIDRSALTDARRLSTKRLSDESIAEEKNDEYTENEQRDSEKT